MDEHTRLAIRRRSQSRPQARYRRVQVVAGAIELGMGHSSMASVSRSTSASMPSASRSASVAAFLRRHILSVMGNPSRSARNAPNMRISIWSMVSTASTSPAWNSARLPLPNRRAASTATARAREASCESWSPARPDNAWQGAQRADTMALESPHDSWTSRPQDRCLGPHRPNAAPPSRLRSTNLRLAYIEQLRFLAYRNHRGVTQIRRALQQQCVIAHVRNRLLGKFEHLDRTELCINRPSLCQRLPAF